MGAIRKILVPTDFSSCADHALKTALEMADRFDASVTLLHVYQMPAYPIRDAPEAIASFLENVDGALSRTKESVEVEGSRIVATTSVDGDAAIEIPRVADEGDYDLIVMGTHGRTGLKHLLIGSLAEKVVRTAKCPVLTVRNGAETWDDAEASLTEA